MLLGMVTIDLPKIRPETEATRQRKNFNSTKYCKCYRARG